MTPPSRERSAAPREPRPGAAVQLVTSPAEAALDLARRLGADVDGVTVLRNGSNVTVLLGPQPLVVKILGGRRRVRRTAEWFEREVAIAGYLRGRVPAVSPATAVPPGPHWHRGHLLSFWDRADVTGVPVPPEVAGEALRRCHRALTGYRPAGGPYDPCAECDRVLDTTPREHFLTGERELLAALAGRLFDAVRGWTGPVQPLHGDPTPENILGTGDLGTRDGYAWCDFEDTYVGATWWDLACLVAPAAAAGDRDFHERATGGYGVSPDDPALAAFVGARVMHSAIWSAYVNTSPRPSRTRLRRLAWLEEVAAR